MSHPRRASCDRPMRSSASRSTPVDRDEKTRSRSSATPGGKGPVGTSGPGGTMDPSASTPGSSTAGAGSSVGGGSDVPGSVAVLGAVPAEVGVGSVAVVGDPSAPFPPEQAAVTSTNARSGSRRGATGWIIPACVPYPDRRSSVRQLPGEVSIRSRFGDTTPQARSGATRRGTTRPTRCRHAGSSGRPRGPAHRHRTSRWWARPRGWSRSHSRRGPASGTCGCPGRCR